MDYMDTSAEGGNAKDVLAQLLMGDNKPTKRPVDDCKPSVQEIIDLPIDENY